MKTTLETSEKPKNLINPIKPSIIRNQGNEKLISSVELKTSLVSSVELKTSLVSSVKLKTSLVSSVELKT